MGGKHNEFFHILRTFYSFVRSHHMHMLDVHFVFFFGLFFKCKSKTAIKTGQLNEVNDVRCTTENIVSDVDELMLLPMRVSFNFMFFSALMRSQFVFLFIFAAVTSNCVYFVTVSKAELSFIRMQTLHLHWNKLMNRMLTHTHIDCIICYRCCW